MSGAGIETSVAAAESSPAAAAAPAEPLPALRRASPSLWSLVRWELYKLARRPASYVGILLSLGFVAVLLGGFLKNDFRALKKWGGLVNPTDIVTAPSFAGFALNIGFFAFLPIIAAMLASGQFAGEAKDGTLRAWLMRPVSRTKVATAKLLATYLWLQVLVLCLVGLALLIGWVALGGGDMLVFVWQFRRDGIWFVTGWEWVACLLVVSFAATLALMVLVTFALFLSALIDNPVVAQVVSLGIFFISSVVQQLPEEVLGNAVRQWLPTTHMNGWHEAYRWFRPGGNVNWERLADDALWCGGFSALFIALMYWVFSRRDITS